jgi:acetylornithine deacetylase
MKPDRERLARTLSELIRIPSVNPFGAPVRKGHREQELAEEVIDWLEALGLETGQREVAPERPNIWGRLRGTGDGPALMLAAHLDTVGIEGCPGAFDPQMEGGRVTGRGACDMKGAIACYLEVLHLLRARGIRLPGDLIIAGIVDEEHLQIGSADMGRNGPHADFGIIGEPTGLQICPAHKGQLGVFIRTHGKATHSSRPEKGINAVEHMAAVMRHLSGLNAELQEKSPGHPLCGTGRFSMNVIRGGSFVSGIPDFCELEVDRRFLPGEAVEAILADYRARLETLWQDMPDLRAELSEPSLLVRALDVPVDSPLVRALSRAVETVLGRPAEIAAFPGGTDAPNLGFPCVICGPGALEQAHSNDEFIEVEVMAQASEIYLKAILALNGLEE